MKTISNNINNINNNNSPGKAIIGRRTDAYSPSTSVSNPLSSSLLSTLQHMSLFTNKPHQYHQQDEFEDELLMQSPTPTPIKQNNRRGKKTTHSHQKNTPTTNNPPLPTPMLQQHQKCSQPMCMPSRRNRTMSQGSTGSNAFSPVSSFSSSYLSCSSPSPHSLNNNNNNGIQPASVKSTTSICTTKKEKDESALLNEIVKDADHAASGNMFRKRNEWNQAVFDRLKPSKRNGFHVRTEDDGPYGNDETRCFVLAQFSAMRVRALRCVMCDDEMVVYDRFPLVDGTLFMSPVNYGKNAISVQQGSHQYVYGVCLSCLNGDNEIRCRLCARVWCADAVQIGTLYKYDVFAAAQCCEARSMCAKCGRCVARRENRDMFFSTYSDECECGWCRAKAHHYIKPLNQIFTVNRLI